MNSFSFNYAHQIDVYYIILPLLYSKGSLYIATWKTYKCTDQHKLV